MSVSGSRDSAPPNFLSRDVTRMRRGSATALGEGLCGILGRAPGPVLLAVDPAIETRDMLDGVLASLGDAGYTPLVLTDFGPEIRDDQMDAAARQARVSQVGAVVGIGGGSVLGAAKMIALLVTNKGASRDWVGLLEPDRPRAPLVLVLTTIGTGAGAEITRISMISVDGEKRVSSSRSFVPELVVLGTSFVESLPASFKGSTRDGRPRPRDQIRHVVHQFTDHRAARHRARPTNPEPMDRAGVGQLIGAMRESDLGRRLRRARVRHSERKT